MSEPEKCTLCQQPRRLILMEGNARWWVNAVPDPKGTVVIVTIEPDGRVRGRVLSGPELPAQGDAYRKHEQTCPFSQEAARLRYIAQPKCPVCKYPLHPLNVADGTTTHPLCLPMTAGEELAAARAALRDRRTG